MQTQHKEQIVLNNDSNQEFCFKLQDESIFSFESKEMDIEIETTKDGFSFIKAGDTSYPIEILRHHQNEYELLINGVSYNFSVETPFSLKRKKQLISQADESTTIRLKAPMPGKILEVMVKPGDAVKAGDTLLILEAMKMQNAILASTKGIIKKVLVKKGNTTSKSDLLIELEKDK